MYNHAQAGSSTRRASEWFRNNWNDFVYAFKDLKTQKVKTFFAIGGILISIFVMQVVGVITDSLSYSYLDASATSAGAADFIITRDLEGISSGGGIFGSGMFMNQTEIQGKLDGVAEIESVFPRLMLLPTVDEVQNGTIVRNRTILLYGLDVPGEDAAGLGRFKIAGTSTYFTGNIPAGSCIISSFIAETLKIGKGDHVTIRYATFPARNLTVHEIVEQQQKFLSFEIDTIVTDLSWLQQTYLLVDKVNYFNCLMKGREYIYDTRNVDGTIQRMLQIAGKIQLALGDEYSVQMLKLSELENSEMMNVAMSVAFIFISIISGLISAILISSILTTAVEDRIREFGIFRVVGSRRTFPFKLVIYQGFFLSLLGSSLGIAGGTWFAQFLLPVLYDWLNMWTNPISLVVQPSTMITSFSLGVGITLLVTAIPAYKAAATKIVHAINPYRHQETGWVVKKEGKVNTQLIAAGVGAVASGSLVFYLIPQLAITGDITVIMIAFIGVQLAFLLGLTLVSLGIVPLIEKAILAIFRLANKKTTPIVGTSLHRYRRRNTSTVLMFAMTFAFILFISTTMELQKVSQTYLIKVNYGTPLVVYSSSTSNQIDENMMRDIATRTNVKMVSGAYTDAIDISALRLQLESTGVGEATGGGLDFDSLFSSNRYYVEIGDLINYYSFTAALIGVDENYTKVMNPRLMEVNGGAATVDKLFAPGKNNIIIARSVANYAQIQVGDNVRLSFYKSGLRNLVNATVAGISDGMPGFWQFREAKITSFYGGVMCSKYNYINWMDMEANATNMPLSKIFVDTYTTTTHDLDILRNDIERAYDDRLKDDGMPYEAIVEHAQNRIDMVLESLNTVSLLFQTILLFAVLIALFGLLSSVYSTVVERKREIGVLKSLGLHNNQTRNMFVMESVIILLASSLGGAMIGILSSYINSYQNTTLTEVPLAALLDPANLPWPTMLVSFLVSLAMCLGGMILLLRKVAKMEIMEIFRSTM
ncbi:MAG: ABC transporter permease [Candidatus Lokiarchaeota archaeon]|nr:ABC transporter permease [Candidatus Lokiarchaeota archaeon]